MSIPVGSREATFVFAIAGNGHSVTWAIGVEDLNIVDPQSTDQMANNMFDNWSSVNAPFNISNMPSSFTFVNVTVAEMTADGPVSAIGGTPVEGSGGQEPVPINCALLVTKNTALGGRRNKGRAYLPPFLPGESQVDVNGNLVTSVRSVIQAQIDAAVLLDEEDLIGYVLFHQTAPFTPTPITNLVLQAQVATQRRRMR